MHHRIASAKWPAVAIAALLLLSSAATAQTTAEEWLTKARDISDLRQPGAHPFHLTVDFQAAESPNVVSGTLDYTWAAPDLWREELTYRDFHRLRARSGKTIYEQPQTHYVPIGVQWIVDHFLPDWNRPATAGARPNTWRLASSSGAPLIVLKRERDKPDELSPLDISIKSDGTPAVSFYLSADYSHFQTFAGKQVALAGSLAAGRGVAESFAIRQLELIDAPPGGTFVLAGAGTRDVKDPSVQTDLKLLKSGDPSFSEYGRQHHLNGTVLIKIGVDDTGIPREMYVLRTLEKSMDAEALKTAAQYRFRPATIDGAPVSTSVMVQVTFSSH